MSLVLILLFSLSTFADNVVVCVVDEQDHSPLPFARVWVKSQQQSYQTDREGMVHLNFNRFPQTVVVSFLGFEDQQLVIRQSQHSYEVVLKPNSFMLDSVHVNGSRKHSRNTANIVALDKNIIAQNQGGTLASILATLPGVRTLSSGAMIEKPIIEGMNGSRISIINNDTKLMGQHWGDDHAPEMSIPAYAHVQVEKGAKSVRYGSNAIGGIIVVDTDIKPDAKPTTGGVNMSYAFNGRMYGADAYVESSYPKISGFRWRAAGKYYRSGNYQTAHYMLDNTGAKLFSGNLDWVFQWSPRWQWQQHVAYYDTQIGVFSGSHISTIDDLLYRFEQGQPPAENIPPFTYRIASPQQKIQHITTSASVLHNIDARNRISMKAAYQMDYRREFDVRTANFSSLPSFAFRLSTFNLHADWQHRFSTDNDLEVGTEFSHIINVTDNNTNAVPIIPNYVSDVMGLYGVYHLRLSRKLMTEMGVRSDYQFLSAKGFNTRGKAYGGDRQYFSLSGTLGLKYMLNQYSNLQTNIGLAWRAPEMNELFAYGVHHGDAVYQIGDDNLRTEKAWKWTLGYHLKKGIFDVRANAFAHYIHDFIYDIPRYTVDKDGYRKPETIQLLAGAFPVFYFVQSDGLFGGLEVMVDVELTTYLNYHLSGEWMRARNISEHTYFPNIPSDRYKHSLTFHSKWKEYQIEATAEHIFVDKQRFFDPDIDLLPSTPPAYHLLNGSLSVKRQFAPFLATFYLQGTNLLNAAYKDYTNRLRYFAHDKGRNVTIGLRFNF